MFPTSRSSLGEVVGVVEDDAPSEEAVVGYGDGIENSQDWQPIHHPVLPCDFIPVIHADRVGETLWSYGEDLGIVSQCACLALSYCSDGFGSERNKQRVIPYLWNEGRADDSAPASIYLCRDSSSGNALSDWVTVRHQLQLDRHLFAV